MRINWDNETKELSIEIDGAGCLGILIITFLIALVAIIALGG